MRAASALVRPPLLRPGAVVVVVEPSSPVPVGRLDAGLAVLRGWGLEVVEAPHLRHTDPDLPYLAGADADRAGDLQEAWLDPDVAAVLCGRGGYGVPRLLDLLDWSAMGRARPKPVLGFSDITPLLHGIGARLGVATVHGPVVTGIGDGDEASREHLRRLLLGTSVGEARTEPFAEGLTTLVPGRAEGPLVGGNLALLAASVGTPDLLPADGAIAVLEDVDETPFRLDRLVTQLLRSGWFEGVRGVVLGGFTGCGDPDQVRVTMAERLRALGVPVVADAPIGHDQPNLAWWMGGRAVLEDGVLSVS